MKSSHKIFFKDSRQMTELPAEAIELVVTSPPYSMIEIWDDFFTSQDAQIGEALLGNNGHLAWDLMHRQLDRVWEGIYRVLKPGAIACINIGDAVRTIDSCFALYPNHSRIQSYLQKLGFTTLPAILWRKQTNAPNKFMGSGRLPPGAYVTLEHEYILIARKGNKKLFKTASEKKLRRESAFFWEERNCWFSDVWLDLKGTGQNLPDIKARERSASFPFELPYRLISMFSVKEDTVLDPFLGTGTTMYAAMAAGRNSIGYEIDINLRESIVSGYAGIVGASNQRITERLRRHLEFVEERYLKAGSLKHLNIHYRFPVMTSQETELILNELKTVTPIGEDAYQVVYADEPQPDFIGCRQEHVGLPAGKKMKKLDTEESEKKEYKQQQLFP